MQRVYKCFPFQKFSNGIYKLIPIREEDKYSIMQWRNEQIDILRQKELLTKEKQEWYFNNVIAALFEQARPNQLLFSFLENDVLIGYGGLVHIDWESRNAEISFLTATERNINQNQFINDWKIYLRILKNITDWHLDFIKIYTYAYDIRPNLFRVLLENNFIEEACLKNHAFINNKWYNVRIHSYFFDSISFRMANKDDVALYFKWRNDEDVRKNSFNSDSVEFNAHSKWFFSKLSSGRCFFYLFFNVQNIPIGQVRIEKKEDETTIGISIDKLVRGKSLSSKMLIKSTDDYLHKNSKEKIVAYIKHENIISYKSFISAGFLEQEIVNNDGFRSYKLFKKKHDRD